MLLVTVEQETAYEMGIGTVLLEQVSFFEALKLQEVSILLPHLRNLILHFHLVTARLRGPHSLHPTYLRLAHLVRRLQYSEKQFEDGSL